MEGQPPPAAGQEGGDRGLTSFVSNVVHNVTTQKPPSTPQIDADVAGLDDAFKGVGTKNDQLIQILCTKPKEYIQQLRAVYNHSHTMDLLSKIQLETSGACAMGGCAGSLALTFTRAGRFQEVFENMLLTDPEYRAHCVHRAVKGIGTDEMMLIDVLLTSSNEQVRQTKAAYQHHFLIPMQLRVDLDTSGKFQGVLDAVLNCKRPESGVDMSAVPGDLETMYGATEGKFGTDEKAILNLVATRSREHLWYLNNAYKTRSPHQRTFTEELKCEISGIFWLQKALVAVSRGFACCLVELMFYSVV